MYTKRYATGTSIVSSREPKVRRAPWSGMRPTFVLPLKLDTQTWKLGAQGPVLWFVPAALHL
eukprot:5198640-Prymnesium_polylepis.1